MRQSVRSSGRLEHNIRFDGLGVVRGRERERKSVDITQTKFYMSKRAEGLQPAPLQRPLRLPHGILWTVCRRRVCSRDQIHSSIRQAHPPRQWRLHSLERQSPIGNSSYRIRRHKCGSRNNNWQAEERIETPPGTSLTCGSGLTLGSAFLKRGRCRSPACLKLTHLLLSPPEITTCTTHDLPALLV